MQTPSVGEVRDNSLFGPRARDRMPASVTDALAAGGGVLVVFGVLLISVDIFADDGSKYACAALFGALIVAGFLGLALLPHAARAGCIAAIALSVPAVYGWLIFPSTDSFGDLRPFFVLTIVTWALCWFIPLSRSRPIFVGLALIVLWLWLLGEVAGLDAFSAAPIPSPPYTTPGDFDQSAHGTSVHRVPGLSALARPTQTVTIDDLDSSDTLYPLAQSCDAGDLQACDDLYNAADPGTDFEAFAQTCGGIDPSGLGGECAFTDSFGDSGGGSTLLTPDPFASSPVDDKTWQIGGMSTAIAVLYLSALAFLDRRGLRGLATAFVLAGVLALATGVSALGDASNHAWIGGLLALAAGLGLGLIGQGTRRRFTAWTGAVFAAVGVLTIALDIANLDTTETIDSESSNVKIAGPGMIVVGCGLVLIVVAVLIALLPSARATPSPSPSPPAPIDPIDATPPGPEAFTPIPSDPWAAPAPVTAPPSAAGPPAAPEEPASQPPSSPPTAPGWGPPSAPAPPSDPRDPPLE